MSLTGIPTKYGTLGYYDLIDWWKNEFNNDEQLYILGKYKPMGGTALTEGILVSSSASSINFLIGLQTWFTTLNDAVISEKILEKAEKLISVKIAIIDVHFLYGCFIKHYYKKRNVDDKFYDLAKVYCKKQIQICETVRDAFISEPWFTKLPAHKGFNQLTIIFEKEKKYSDALELCIKAKEMGWKGLWDKRINNLVKKIG